MMARCDLLEEPRVRADDPMLITHPGTRSFAALLIQSGDGVTLFCIAWDSFAFQYMGTRVDIGAVTTILPNWAPSARS
jgi:hypothetical protein